MLINMHIFLFNKSLRVKDNTTLIDHIKKYKSITPIFIFTEQVNKKKNKYFSNNSCEFMCESLVELANDIKTTYSGELYFFHNDDLIKCLNEIHNKIPIETLATNFDYSPYATKRQELLKKFTDSNNIIFNIHEDHLLFPLLDGQTRKINGEPYSVFTPFKNHCSENLKVNKPDSFNKFSFSKHPELKHVKSYLPLNQNNQLDIFYEFNPHAHIRGGRLNGLAILKKLDNFKTYNKERDYLIYDTTFLAAHNHFGTVSIREVYWAIIDKLNNKNNLITELIWRDFYYNLFYNNPHMLGGMIGHTNKAFKPKYDNIKWNYDKELFKKWCKGQLGIPLCDAAMIQLNETGFQHNRMRMLTASVATKLLLLPWYWCEKYFAQKLLDYDCVQNAGGWGWTVTGIDPTQTFRIFSPQSQSLKFDADCVYIKKYLPVLKDLEPKQIHKWEETYKVNLEAGVKYLAPVIDYKKSRIASLKELGRVNKLKIN